jgi:hypothetical protein
MKGSEMIKDGETVEEKIERQWLIRAHHGSDRIFVSLHPGNTICRSITFNVENVVKLIAGLQEAVEYMSDSEQKEWNG